MLRLPSLLYVGFMVVLLHWSNAEEDEAIPSFNLDDVFIPTIPTDVIANTEDAPRSRQARSAVANRQYLWPNGEVRFAFLKHPTKGVFTEAHKTTIRRAMNYIEANTCVKFIEITQDAVFKNPNEKLLIAGGWRGADCQSEVGMLRRTRVQVTWFLTGCLSEKGGNSVAHELMHTLGFYHEHTRPDRDEYITVNTENIASYGLPNFRKLSERNINLLDTEYDYQSVLHYKTYQYLKPNRAFGDFVLQPLKDDVEIGQRNAPSVMDLFRINRLYNCPATTVYGKGVKCLDCISHLTIVASTSTSLTAGTTSSHLTLNMVVADGPVFKTVSHKLAKTGVMSLTPGSVKVWRVRLDDNCTKLEDIRTISIRAGADDDWMVQAIDVYAKVATSTVLVAGLDQPHRRLTLDGTEAESQVILRPAEPANCTACQSQCIQTLSVTVKYNSPQASITPLGLILRARLGLAVQWLLADRVTTEGVKNSRVQRFTYNVSGAAGCVRSPDVINLAIANVVSGRFRTLPSGLQALFVVGSTGEGDFVMNEEHYSQAEQALDRSLIFARPQTCGRECSRCA